jgi:hypothetical protein
VPNLTHIPLKLTYRTGRDDLVHDFFVPCLETAALYRRAAGYFTSAGLALATRGVASLARRRGHMRLVVSPHLEPNDCAALERAQENPAAVLRTIAARSLAEIEGALIKDRLNALAWPPAVLLLEVKLAGVTQFGAPISPRSLVNRDLSVGKRRPSNRLSGRFES